MSERAFTEKTPAPDDALLAKTLGKTGALWRDLLAHVEQEHGPIRQEWKHYPSSGWTLKALLGKRNLFLLIPHLGSFVVGFVLGDQAVAAVAASSLPEAMIATLKSAKKYAEGRGLRVAVTTRKDVAHVEALVRIKVQN